MKKNLFTVMLFLMFFGFNNIGYCEQIPDMNTIVSQTSMPSDAQIREVINKYDFDENQKEYLFKETKRKLQEIYAQKGKNVPLSSDLNMPVDSTLLNANQNIENSTLSGQKKKKYASHDPLTRRNR